MSFLDEARTRSEWKPRTPCRTGGFVGTLSGDELTSFVEALNDPTVTQVAIVAVLLSRHGFKVSTSSLQNHRAGLCRCG